MSVHSQKRVNNYLPMYDLGHKYLGYYALSEILLAESYFIETGVNNTVKYRPLNDN